jgi:hypothetical protein
MRTLLAGAVESIHQNGDASAIHVRRYSSARIDSRSCVCYEINQPWSADGEIARRRVFFDKRQAIPIRFEWFAQPAQLGEEPPLVEAVTFRRVILDAKLTPRDFDATNVASGLPTTPLAVVRGGR